MENSLIKPIKTEEQYQVVLQQIRSLWNCPENSSEADTLELLSILADDYENKYHAIEPPDLIEAIKYKMEEDGLSAADLIPYFGSRSRVSEVLNRKRPLLLLWQRSFLRA
jgi:HTH-type transcriptional regulator / antitoxin HigA